MKENVDKIREKLKTLLIDCSENKAELLLRYYQMLVEKNKVMNLTAITDFDEVLEKHFADSLSVVRVVDVNKINSLIDVGTGAGFPGIPLKIIYPEMNVTLLDSLKKRVNFLNEVIDELDLKNIGAIHGRAEDFGRNRDYREKYDICVSRAVANLSSLSEYCLPFVKVGGVFIAYKSGKCHDEICNAKNAIKTLSGKIEKIENFNLPDTDISRTFVLINKINPMHNKYPRKSGVPSKNPL